MTPLGNLVLALATVLDIAITLMFLVFLARVVLSWLQAGQGHPLVQAVYALSEPLLAPIRRAIWRLIPGASNLPLDLSPLAAFLALVFVRAFLVPTLVQLGRSLTF